MERLLAELDLHFELSDLTVELQQYCADLDISIEEMLPGVDEVIPILPNGTVIGNWPMYDRACRERRLTVRTQEHFELAFEDPALVTLSALTSLARNTHSDRLLEGLIYRQWRKYEDREVALRGIRLNDQGYREGLGRTHRQQLQDELCRQLRRCVRDLQRFALVLDLPTVWLRLHRQCQISFSVLERLAGLPLPDLDDLMDELKAGAAFQDLLDDYVLKPSRSHRRVTNALQEFIRQLSKGLTNLDPRSDEVQSLNPAQLDVLNRAEGLIQKLICKPVQPTTAC